jgi:uracil-DNA glycosylase family 4
VDLLAALLDDIVACERCPRLRAHCEEIARVKRRAYRDQQYWGRPVPSFGDPAARLLIVGLAPGAHGANRTGRMFTGDRSGDFLYKALHATGFASQPWSRARGDGLALRDAWITAAVRCAPPDNKPSPEEFRNCRAWLDREVALLGNVLVVVALGKLAFDAYLATLRVRGLAVPRLHFAHNALHRVAGAPPLISSYHPSQQNTQTGRLTEAMLRSVFRRARRIVERTS